MPNNIDGKKVLFLCVQFFGYEKDIADALRKKGAEVTYYDERHKNTIFNKILIRYFKYLTKRIIANYYRNIIKEIEKEAFDYLFVLKAEVVPLFFLRSFRELNPNAQNVLYLWDSLKVNFVPKEIRDQFHKICTFDHNDAYKECFQLVPLFYSDRREPDEQCKNIDVSFIGTLRVDRWRIISRLKKQFPSDWNLYFYVFVPSKWAYWYNKLLYFKANDHIRIKDVSFSPLSKSDVTDVFCRSQIVVDIHHPSQFGLTMRSIEAIGAGARLITTNPNIKKYNVYDEQRAYIIDRYNPKVSIDWLIKKIKPEYNDFSRSFHIDQFICNLFGDEKYYLVENSDAMDS